MGWEKITRLIVEQIVPLVIEEIRSFQGVEKMSTLNFKVSIPPIEALDLVKQNENADLVHEEIHDLGKGIYIGTLIFEKYYMRVKNRVALVVIIDNIYGETDVRSIATGSSEGMIFNFDWGAADSFAGSVQDILDEYIIQS